VILNFGPATITHNSVDLGKTSGGGTISLDVEQVIELSGEVREYITGGRGTINLFKLSASLTYDTSIDYSLFAPLIIAGTTYVFTIPLAKILLPSNYDFGDFTQRSVTMRFVIKPGSAMLTVSEP
jgi:hypothetical protein